MQMGSVVEFHSKLFYEKDEIARNGHCEVRIIRMKRIENDSMHIYEGELIRTIGQSVPPVDNPLPFDELGDKIDITSYGQRIRGQYRL